MTTKTTSKLMIFAVLALAGAHVAAESLEGQWILEEEGQDAAQLVLSYRETSSTGNWNEQTRHRVALDALEGLDAVSFGSRAGATVAFDLRREAGTFACEGWAHDGRASGHFSFLPDSAFSRELERLGFGPPSPRESLSLALSDTGTELATEIARAGYDGVSVRQLVRASRHGVTGSYIREVRGLGFEPASLDALIRMHDHGVTPGFIREILSLGIAALDENGIVRLRDHGVTPEFARAMKAAGFQDLDARQLVRLRDHGVTPEYARAMRDAGLRRVTPDELVRLRDHGVRPEDVRSFRTD